jgi:hypothetical protein
MCLVPENRLSLGLLIWGATALLCGWATARFGIIIDVEPVTVEWMNTLGVILCLVALGTYFFVETDATATGASDSDSFPSASHFDMESPLTDSTPSHQYDLVSKNTGGSLPSAGDEEEAGYIDSMSPGAKRLCGVLLSVASGLFYGCNFLPPQYLSDHHAEGHSKDLPRCVFELCCGRWWLVAVVVAEVQCVCDCIWTACLSHHFDRWRMVVACDAPCHSYVFSHFTGILAAAAVYFSIYCWFMRKSQPFVNPKSVLVGLLVGSIWAGAQICVFFASSNLNQVIAFPIVSSGPGLVGALWGIFVFKEIKGARNLGFIALAFVITIAGVLLIAMSKT